MAADDDDVWKAYAKGVKPLPRIAISKTTKPRRKNLEKITAAGSRSRASLPPREADGTALTQSPLDRNVEKKLRQGSMEVEARLDLHGMVQAAAHHALEIFVEKQIKAGRRCLLIITGKGRGGEGVLRNSLAGWLAALPHARQILALRPASPKHGGDGAFYILMRRVSPKK